MLRKQIFMVNNMILQGDKITWIDTNDSSREFGAMLKPTLCSQGGIEAHHELIDLDDPEKVEHYFLEQINKSSGIYEKQNFILD